MPFAPLTRSSAVLCSALLTALCAAPSVAQPIPLDQGSAWNDAARQRFYSLDQGSRLVPLAWIRAVQDEQGQPFMADGLSRYGYLPNGDEADPAALPLGFSVARESGQDVLGMTCAACHTREIRVGDVAYRIDGGPAFADLQAMLEDLDSAFDRMLGNDASFVRFASEVAGEGAPAGTHTQLRASVEQWHDDFHLLLERSLPDQRWGPGRFDCVALIFNAVAGQDVAPPPLDALPDNMELGRAPTRYPFLWNAWRQQRTQWTGFAANGNALLGLARNLGELYGVFGWFNPVIDPSSDLGVDYLNEGSMQFDGLLELERLSHRIGPPAWPFAIDEALALQGAGIYQRPTEQGGCVACHAIQRNPDADALAGSWLTPVLDVGTDHAAIATLQRTSATGVLEGVQLPLGDDALAPIDSSSALLRNAVIGSIIQWQLQTQQAIDNELPNLGDLTPLSATQGEDAAPGYAARVLHGIWASAPYLHNGSVPSLAELLKPADRRISSFAVGPVYDPNTVGLALEQPTTDFVLHTTGCEDTQSGNSRCGHEYGVNLSPSEKRALLEFLKLL